MPNSKAENIEFGGRSDEREKPCLIHPCQPNIHRALMRVTIVPTSQPEFKALVHRVDTRVTVMPGSSMPHQGLSCSLMLKTSVPAPQPENIGFGGLADARELPC